jgi:hypothetical protein
MEMYNLDRENNIQASVDALGKKWEIHYNKQTGLCYARPNPDRSDAQIPKDLEGLWTKPSLLAPRIKKYVTDTWDHADRIKQENERKVQAAKEHAALEKKEAKPKKVKADSDKGSTSD